MAGNSFDLLPQTVITASANGAEIEVPDGTMLEIDVKVSAQTGITAFSLWLEHSNDAGANWYEKAFDRSSKSTRHTTPAAAEGTIRTNAVNIVNNETTSAVVARYQATYAHLGGLKIRPRWFFTGTDVTVAIKAAIK